MDDLTALTFVCPECRQRFALSAGVLLVETEADLWTGSEGLSIALCAPCAMGVVADRLAVGT